MGTANTAYVIDIAGPLVTIDPKALEQLLGLEDSWSDFAARLGTSHLHTVGNARTMYFLLRSLLSASRTDDVLELCHQSVKPSLDLRYVRRVMGKAPCVITAECDPVTLLAAQYFIVPHLPNVTIVSSTETGALKSERTFWERVRRELQLSPDQHVIDISQSGDPREIAVAEAAFAEASYSRVLFEPGNTLLQWQAFAQSRPASAAS